MSSFAISTYSIGVPMYLALCKYGTSTRDGRWSFPSYEGCFDDMVNADIFRQGYSLVGKELDLCITDKSSEYESWCDKHSTEYTLSSLSDDDLYMASDLTFDLKWKDKPQGNVPCKQLNGFKNLMFHPRAIKATKDRTIFSVALKDGRSRAFFSKHAFTENQYALPSAIQHWMERYGNTMVQSATESLIVPVIDFDDPVNLQPILNASFTSIGGQELYLSQADSYISIVLDLSVVRSKSEFQAPSTTSKTFIYDPFTFWVMRDGFDYPIVSAYLDSDSWLQDTDTEDTPVS